MALSPLHQRKAASILGALVADAAATPLHWIYDQGKVASLTNGGENYAFYPTCECPYYKLATGRLSAYGDQTFATLKSVAGEKKFDIEALQKQYFEFFGPGTDYADALQQRAQGKAPVIGPWTNVSVRIFLDKYASGDKPFTNTSSHEPDGLVKSIPVIALFAGKKGAMLEAADRVIQTMQESPQAIAYGLAGARILEYFILAHEDPVKQVCSDLKQDDRAVPKPADAEALAAIEKTLSICSENKPHAQVVQENGLSCPFPGSFIGGLHCILCSDSFESAVKNATLAAGDNCGRIGIVGACMGAKYGIDSIPEEWVLKMTCAKDALQYIETLVQIE